MRSSRNDPFVLLQLQGDKQGLLKGGPSSKCLLVPNSASISDQQVIRDMQDQSESERRCRQPTC